MGSKSQWIHEGQEVKTLLEVNSPNRLLAAVMDCRLSVAGLESRPRSGQSPLLRLVSLLDHCHSSNMTYSKPTTGPETHQRFFGDIMTAEYRLTYYWVLFIRYAMRFRCSQQILVPL